MADTNDAGAKTGDTGSNPTPFTTGNLRDRLMQAVSPVIQPKAAPEPVILEEHVVEKTPEKRPEDVTAEDVGLKLPTPSPQVSASLKPIPMMQMPPPKIPSPEVPDMHKPPEHVLPSPIALTPLSDEAPLAPSAPAISPAPPHAAPPTAKPNALSSASLGAITSQIPVSPKKTEVTATQSGNMQGDIQKILSQVKLPERRDFKGAADAKLPPTEMQKPKNMAAMVMKPPQDEETAREMVAKPDANTISSVHTLKDDLQHAVREKKMSLVRAVSLEQDKKRDSMVEEEFGRRERRKRTTSILFATFLLFGLGFAALFGVYFVMMSHSGSNVQSLNSIVFAEQSVALPLDNTTPSELKRRIAAARQGQLGSLGSITRIVPLFQNADPATQPTEATTAQFFQALGLSVPDDLMRSLGTTFFFGLHVVDKNAPVLVIPVTNYDRAFASMLSWEATMNPDLAPAFTPVPTTILDANGIPSSRIFQDDVMRNYDVRELKDDSGTVELYYSFPSKNLLIIAESPYSFPELLSRLQSVRRL